MSSGTEPDLRPPGAAFAASACPERSRGCRAIFFPLRRAGFVPPPRGYVLSPSTFLPLPELRASCTSYDQMFFYLLHYPTSVNARLSFVSRWHDKVERHPNLIIGDHGYRLLPPITAGRQQIPSAIARVAAQQVGPAFDFKSHFWLRLPFWSLNSALRSSLFAGNTVAKNVLSRVLQSVPVTTRGAAGRPCFAKSEKRIANNRSSRLSYSLARDGAGWVRTPSETASLFVLHVHVLSIDDALVLLLLSAACLAVAAGSCATRRRRLRRRGLVHRFSQLVRSCLQAITR